MNAMATRDLLFELNATGWDAGVFYPVVKTPPMESTWHALQFAQILSTLVACFSGDNHAFVTGDVPVYYERGNPRRFVVPDCFVVTGIPKEPMRRSYFSWAEGKFPDFILELLSDGTRQRDLSEKIRLYEQVFQTPEYFVCDPDAQAVRGHRLASGHYQELGPDDVGRVWSETLNLGFGMLNGWLCLYRHDGTLIPTMEELLRGS